MSDVEKRLRLADPVAAASYEHHDSDAMVTRIMSQYPRRRAGLLRGFKLKVAGSATLAAALTVGGIAAMNGAVPSLAVLAIGSTHHPKDEVPASTSFAGTMAIYARYQFHAGDTLSGDAATTPSYQLRLPTNPSNEAQRLAAIFGVDATPVDTNGDGTDWTVAAVNGPTLDYQNYGGVPQWYYTSSSPDSAGTSSTSTATSVVGHTVLEADAQHYLGQLGYDFTVADPQFSTSTITTTGPASTSNQATVSYTVLVNGVASDQSVSFTVDANNELVDASGPSFNVTTATGYPLISPTDGVALLNAQQARQFAPSGTEQTNGTTATTTPVTTPSTTSPVTTTPATSAPGSSGSGSSEPTTTVVTAPPLIDVTLSDASVSLESFDTTDGSVWMLPVYVYTGTFTGPAGAAQSGTWTLLAVQRAYVDVRGPASPIAY